jgi:hypothetical protein
MVPGEQDLLDRVRQLSSEGTFEAHITIDAFDLNERERFRQFCVTRKLKSILIELPQGQTRSQPMTSSYHRGEVQSVAHEVIQMARSMSEANFTITRVKLEAVITNQGVPHSDEQARALSPNNYFEFHTKLLLPPETDLDALRRLCQRHDAHLSRNALKQHAEGLAERFVTLRLYHLGRINAEGAFERLLHELRAENYKMGNSLREYAIYDSNIGLDSGWIDATEHAEE